MKIKLAENIRSLRKEHALTQEQLAEALGVTVGAVYKWEAGLSTPEIRLIIELADLFAVSVDVLLGYEQRNNTIEAVMERLEQGYMKKEFIETVAEAERALKKYPNHFLLVYRTALVYQMKFLEDKEEASIVRSNELFQHAISLLYQNTDKEISEVTILNSMAENYLLIEKNEHALELLKHNNICGINNGLIGLTYAMTLHQPKEAMPYLTQSFADSMKSILQTAMGMANMYKELKEEKVSKDTLLWLIGFLDSIKLNDDDIVCTDKIKAFLIAQCAVCEAEMEHFDKAEESIREAFLLAKQFDEVPQYGAKGIRFLDEEDILAMAYDDLGKTAIEAIENLFYQDLNLGKVKEFICDKWEICKEENLS